MAPAPPPQAEEWTYEISWLDGDDVRFGEFSEAAGKELISNLKKTCGAFSHRMVPASGGPVIRSL